MDFFFFCGIIQLEPDEYYDLMISTFLVSQQHGSFDPPINEGRLCVLLSTHALS